MRRHGSPQELERVRREAAALHAEGVSCPQIAAALDRSERTVQGWVAKAREHGVEALAAKPHAGAKPKLSDRQRERLRRQLLKGAEAHGFDTDLWTASRVQELIGRLYGVEYELAAKADHALAAKRDDQRRLAGYIRQAKLPLRLNLPPHLPI